eukprot:8130580-Karenia_brevis.AAC.1
MDKIQKQIKKRFCEQAMKVRPDKNLDNAAYAAAKFGRAKEAHDILMDENRLWDLADKWLPEPGAGQAKGSG